MFIVNKKVIISIILFSLAFPMLSLLSGCEKSDTSLELENLKNKNNQLEATIKDLNKKLQDEEKINNQDKAELQKTYNIEFKDEITNKIIYEHRWLSVKYISIAIVFLIIYTASIKIKYNKEKK